MSYPKAHTSHAGEALGVPSAPDFPALEERVLAYWKEDDTFRASVQARPAGQDGENEFVFYDGPPFANGLPHYGHLLTGYVKDVIPRYQTMRGKHVERRFGWDTHGLPAELEAQRLLGISTKKEIEEMGIGAFNAECRSSVLRYTDEWRNYVTRQARWVDFDNDYKTLNPQYMESVIWAFKSLYDKGLVYKGHKVLPYCWNDETPLSNHELRMDDEVYQQRQDPSVAVWVALPNGDRLVAWTTTPWTLPTNLAMAVGNDVEYVAVRAADGERYVVAQARLGHYAKEFVGPDGDPKNVDDLVEETFLGSALVGQRYTPIFDYFTDVERWGTHNAFQVIHSDSVTTEDGTGVVHMASAYGEVDQADTAAHGIPTILSVDDRAEFTSVVPDFQGLQVFEANRPIINKLKENGQLVREESYVHSYPHCWRCRKPLIYKAVGSWFVEVTKIRDRMVETNEDITWVPEHVKHGQFGKWLEGARDWSISRNRYWGSPIPVWVSDDPEYPRTDVYGSLEEIEKDFGRLPRNADGEVDLHRPFIDELTRPNPDDPTGQATMRRVPEVLDCWFDSGSMPYAQVHYPFENADWFENHYPGDFIVEYIGQTRGWFYTMHILATALFDRPAFTSVLSHGIVLGNDGQKMSKSLRNYPDVNEVFARDGADAMRWFLMSSPILRGGNLIVTEQGIREGVRAGLLPLWNVWYFFSLYANAVTRDDGTQGYEATWRTDSTDVLDKYLLAKLHDLVTDVTAALEVYDIAAACESVRVFCDVLTNWYVRRSRDRFWDTSGADATVARDAFDTLYTTLEVLTRLTAPLLPMASEEIWRGLTGERSVHLADWPNSDDLPANPALVQAMDRAREVCSTTSSLRKSKGLRNRLPLAELTVVTDDPAALEQFTALISDEVNVKKVTLLATDQASAADFGITQRLTVNARAAGPRLGKQVQAVIKGSKTGDWTVEDNTVVCAGIELEESEYTLETVVAQTEGSASASAMLPRGGFVVLDTTITAELAAEGVARDIIRAVQQARKDAGFDVTDRISLTITGEGDVWEAVKSFGDLITSETLATQFGSAPTLEALPEEGSVTTTVGDGQPIRLLLKKL
ncbi:Isoleucine--tRNA ligase [Dermatophilus congolensis]|uniref:Isoleucine--tRNA ligase n=1 Tax=Dermatophilus congolensis TaxID=1863 RepID=A0AA46H056_9MICO|nr:isoleucine--tRNA ligase [Dermatophilus congolensis]STD07327.1 Isoleucine--tRNA ligase [Dermatophilus congolensis]